MKSCLRDLLLLLLFAGAFSVCGYATDPPKDPFSDARVLEIQALHDQSAAGNKKATDKLLVMLETLIEDDPDNALFQVYLGSAWTLKSRDAFPGPSKLKYLKTGLKTMDSAVSSDPKNPCVRFVRAVNNFHLPSFINRRDNARKDFEILLTAIQKNDYGLSRQTRQAIHYFAGLAFKQTDREREAREAWLSGITLGLDSPLTRKMKEELDRLNS